MSQGEFVGTPACFFKALLAGCAAATAAAACRRAEELLKGFLGIGSGDIGGES